MNRESKNNLSEFMTFLAEQHEDGDRLPSLTELSGQLGSSVASLREQMEVARAFGLIEVKPRTGIRRQHYSFKPALLRSLEYAIAVDPAYFKAYADLRIRVEAAFWFPAVTALTQPDKEHLMRLVERAEKKLANTPVQAPHGEHRELHLSVYSRLNNPFVTGILEAYWEIYEEIGLSMTSEVGYLQNVWRYHRRMVESICSGNYQLGYQMLTEHNDLLFVRPVPAARPQFE